MLTMSSPPTTQMRRQESSIRTNLLENDAGGQPREETRTPLRMILDRSPPAHTPDSCDILNRLRKRFSGQAKVYRDDPYQIVAKFLRWKLPDEPQPQHHHCQSKRKWEAAMQGWRKELKKLSLEANAAVVTLQQWFIQQWLHPLVHADVETLNSIPIDWCILQKQKLLMSVIYSSGHTRLFLAHFCQYMYVEPRLIQICCKRSDTA